MNRTKRNVPARAMPALAPEDSLSMLRSAVGYVMQSGLTVRARNIDGGRLLIIVSGAQVDYNQPAGKFVPAPDSTNRGPALADVPAHEG